MPQNDLKFKKAKRIEWENQITKFIATLIKQKTGKGPNVVRVKILEEMIYITFEGVLTDYERYLLRETSAIEEIKHLRDLLINNEKKTLLLHISQIMGQEVDLLYCQNDILKDQVKIAVIIK